jgi:hypothetical protein
MARGAFDALLLFLLPFIAYVLMLLVGRRYPFLAAHWTSGKLALLTVAGLCVLLLCLLVFGLAAPRGQGAYSPAHVENGHLVPGRLE